VKVHSKARKLSAAVRGAAHRGDRWAPDPDEAPARPVPSLVRVAWLNRPDPDELCKATQQHADETYGQRPRPPP
jgi:hypothetical protein